MWNGWLVRVYLSTRCHMAIHASRLTWVNRIWFTLQLGCSVAGPHLSFFFFPPPTSPARRCRRHIADYNSRPADCTLLSLTYSPTVGFLVGGGGKGDLKNVQCFTASELTPSLCAQQWVLLLCSASPFPLPHLHHVCFIPPPFFL